MTFLTKIADEIVSLIDSHGEIIDCRVEGCQGCDNIRYKRSLICQEVNEGRKHPNKYYYLITDLNTNKQNEFRTQVLAAEFLKISVFDFKDLINKKLVIDNIKVELLARDKS